MRTGIGAAVRDGINAELSNIEHGPGGQASEPIYRLLAELLQRPELLVPPECVLPRLGYRGRGVLLCGPDKSGKSTLLAHGVAALTRGRTFLGESTNAGRVVWCGLEEATGDAVRRFHQLGADPDRIQLVTLAPTDLLKQTDQLLGDWPADLWVVDSLQEYARVTAGETPGDGDNAAWGSIVRPAVALARKHDISLIVLHHARRSDGAGRGASEIFAAVDATLELYLPTASEDPTVRRIQGRGRWPIERFTVRLQDGHYSLGGGGQLSTDALVLLHVEQNPGATKSGLRKAVKARATAVDAAIHQLEERGAIQNRGTEDRPRYYTPSDQSELGVK